MTRANYVKKAAKDYPAHGIKKGESYYWWKHRFSPKQYSKTKPKRSQLTQSDYLSRIYDLQDNFALDSATSPEEIENTILELVDQLSELRDECEEKRDNMPESLQESDTGNLLQERYDALDNAINILEGIDLADPPGYSSDEIADHEAYGAWVGSIESEVSSALGDL